MLSQFSDSFNAAGARSFVPDRRAAESAREAGLWLACCRWVRMEDAGEGGGGVNKRCIWQHTPLRHTRIISNGEGQVTQHVARSVLQIRAREARMPADLTDEHMVARGQAKARELGDSHRQACRL